MQSHPDPFLRRAKHSVESGDHQSLDRELRAAKPFPSDEPSNRPDMLQENATLLHHSCKHDQPECARVLLLHRADPNSKLKNGQTPLHLAVQHGEKCLKHLLDDEVRAHTSSARLEEYKNNTHAPMLMPTDSSLYNVKCTCSVLSRMRNCE